MCTVSWVYDAEGYELLCNRDEKRTRARASEPRLLEHGGSRYLAPIDGDFGGTWLAVNDHGITLCLVNGALGEEQPSTPTHSRGLLLPELIAAADAWEVCERVWDTDLSPYAPFTLAVLEPGEPARAVEWNGAAKSVFGYAEPLMPLVSSSFDSEGVRRSRRAAYESARVREGGVTSRMLHGFHRHHGEQPTAYSTCMHRPDAETVSFSHVEVRERGITFHYAASAPCRMAATQSITLDRRA